MPTIYRQIRNEVKNEYEVKVKEVKNEFEREKEEIAKRLIKKGIDIDTIGEITGISREKLEQLSSIVH